jgi:hypothetical protein
VIRWPLSLIALLAALPLRAEVDPRLVPLIDRAFAEARAECEAEGGTLVLPETLRSESVDLTGDGRPDLVFSEEGAFCGPDLGFVGGGSAGARVHVIVGDHVQSLLPGNWTVTRLQFRVEDEVMTTAPVLVMAVHGLFCDSFGAAPCFLAYGWDGARMVSVLDGLSLWSGDEDDAEP